MPNTQASATAARLFECFSAGDIPGVMDLLSDDATWFLPGKKGQLPVVGTRSKAQIARLFENMAGRLDGPLKMTVKGAIADGGKVAMEVESLGHLKNGRTYQQQYHFLITVRGDRITSVREYLDTGHAQAVWYSPAPADIEQPQRRLPVHASLDAFLGQWKEEGRTLDQPHPGKRVSTLSNCEWLPGKMLMVRAWTGTVGAEQQKGVQMMGLDPATGSFFAHFFDSPNVVRIYVLTVDAAGVWRINGRTERGRIVFSDGGRTMTTSWQASQDGAEWLPLCDVVATRIHPA